MYSMSYVIQVSERGGRFGRVFWGIMAAAGRPPGRARQSGGSSCGVRSPDLVEATLFVSPGEPFTLSPYPLTPPTTPERRFRKDRGVVGSACVCVVGSRRRCGRGFPVGFVPIAVISAATKSSSCYKDRHGAAPWLSRWRRRRGTKTSWGIPFPLNQTNPDRLFPSKSQPFFTLMLNFPEIFTR